MAKPKITADQCTDRVQKAVDTLQSEGATPEVIVEALVQVALKAGQKSRRAEAVFDAAMNAFSDAAFGTFEQAKKDRATKRRKSLGLPEE